MKARSAELSVGAEGYVSTAESNNPAVLIGALVMFMANWLSHQDEQNSEKEDGALRFSVLLHGLQGEALTIDR